MVDLINPNTNRSINQEKVLLELQRWTIEPSVIRVMFEEKLCDLTQMKLLAIRVAATLRPNDPELSKMSKPMTARETAICALRFLDTRSVRQQLAKLISRQQKIPKNEAMEGLWAMRTFLRENYNIDGVRRMQEAGLLVVD